MPRPNNLLQVLLGAAGSGMASVPDYMQQNYQNKVGQFGLLNQLQQQQQANDFRGQSLDLQRQGMAQSNEQFKQRMDQQQFETWLQKMLTTMDAGREKMYKDRQYGLDKQRADAYVNATEALANQRASNTKNPNQQRTMPDSLMNTMVRTAMETFAQGRKVPVPGTENAPFPTMIQAPMTPAASDSLFNVGLNTYNRVAGQQPMDSTAVNEFLKLLEGL